jgi:glycosyltransferase involved in cell wall biosynthesis
MRSRHDNDPMEPRPDGVLLEPVQQLPLVSVVVPVWNGETHLRESLDSILGQTYPRLEVIVVDDASTDSTPDILASYGDRIRVHSQQSTRGIYGNANDGIALARGELIGVFHADDVYLENMVEREVEWLRCHTDAAAVYCCVVFVDSEGREFARQKLPPEVRGNRQLEYPEVLNTLLSRKNSFLACPTALVRAAVYEDVGGYRDQEFKNTSDLEMWLRIARKHPLGVLEDQLLLYRRGHGSSSERYHQLRTDPERFFHILDLELESPRGRAEARPEALRDFEAHRAHDTVMRAVNHYILGQRNSARAVLREVQLRDLAASRRVQRFRMLLLTASLRLLLRLPRSTAVAGLFERRWHAAQTLAGRR